MSGRNRNTMPSAESHTFSARYLPEIVTARPSISPYNYNENQPKSRMKSSSSDLQRSCASSALSRRFQDLFYKSGWPSLSDTGTDSSAYIEIESSGSSASSMFSWADPDATSLVAEEWEKIQRTLYDEEGPKVHHKHLINECDQWKAMFPHLRVIGEKCTLNNVISKDSHDTEEEILETQYDSDAAGNCSVKSYSKNLANIPNNKKNKSIHIVSNFSTRKDILNNHKIVKNHQNSFDVLDEFDQCLQITSVNKLNNNSLNHEKVSSIIRSEISSSRWKNKRSSPDSLYVPYKNNLHYESQSTFTDRDSSAISAYSFVHKTNFVKNRNIKILEDYSNANNNYDEIKISAYSTDTISRNYMTNHDIITVAKNHPIRSISISHDTNISSSKNSRGRNIFLPPLKTNDIKLSNREIKGFEISNKNRSEMSKKNLDPIILQPDLSSKLDRNIIELKKKTRKKKKK